MKGLELKIPPVAVFIVFIVLIHQVSHEWLTLSLPLPFSGFIFLVCVLFSGYVGLAGLHEFKKHQTTVNPIKVETASKVVCSGVFSYTRNPMYLGLVVLLFGFAYWQKNAIGLILPFGFVFYMNRFQIEPEERAMEKRFGRAYRDYKSKVRRWL